MERRRKEAADQLVYPRDSLIYWASLQASAEPVEVVARRQPERVGSSNPGPATVLLSVGNYRQHSALLFCVGTPELQTVSVRSSPISIDVARQ